MSSTNRGYDRHKSDYYVTPQDEIIKFLENYRAGDFNDIGNNIIFDPCCGGDVKNEASYPSALREWYKKDIKILTNDIREDSKSDYKEDYINMELNFKPSIIITNPPFNISMDIIKKALNDVAEDGIVVMLLRLNYFGTKERNSFMLDNMPESCYIHSKRMSFTEDGKKDSVEYAHFVWRKGYNPEYTKTYLLKY